MAHWRRRRLGRNALVFLGSLIAHVGVFFLAASEFTFYPQPEIYAPPIEMQIVPQQELPPPPPFIRPKEARIPAPAAAPPPIELPRTAPSPQPQAAAAPKAPPNPAVAATAPTLVPHRQAPAPVVRAPLLPQQLAPAISTEVEAPHAAVPKSSVQVVRPQTASAPHLVLHRSRQTEGEPLAPSISIPGAVMAPAAQASRGTPAAGAPGGGSPGGGMARNALPAGVLPGVGPGLRGSPLGCAMQDALNMTAAEREHCADLLGEGARESPVMDPIAARRSELDREAAQESAAERYRDSAPAGSAVTPIAGQPRLFHKPGE